MPQISYTILNKYHLKLIFFCYCLPRMMTSIYRKSGIVHITYMYTYCLNTVCVTDTHAYFQEVCIHICMKDKQKCGKHHICEEKKCIFLLLSIISWQRDMPKVSLGYVSLNRAHFLNTATLNEEIPSPTLIHIQKQILQ